LLQHKSVIHVQYSKLISEDCVILKFQHVCAFVSVWVCVCVGVCVGVYVYVFVCGVYVCVCVRARACVCGCVSYRLWLSNDCTL